MKYLVTIILSISLYAPQVAKFLAYAECSALAVTMADKNWCDCMLSADTDNDGIPATEKQKDIQLKTDWKFTPERNMALISQVEAVTLTLNEFLLPFIPLPTKAGVFHPPLC